MTGQKIVRTKLISEMVLATDLNFTTSTETAPARKLHYQSKDERAYCNLFKRCQSTAKLMFHRFTMFMSVTHLTDRKDVPCLEFCIYENDLTWLDSSATRKATFFDATASTGQDLPYQHNSPNRNCPHTHT